MLLQGAPRGGPPGGAHFATGGGWWRDRGVVLTGAALLLVAAVAWEGLIRQALRMEMAMPGGMFSLPEALAFVVAWGVMMVAMMLPSAIPMIALYRTVS